MGSTVKIIKASSTASKTIRNFIQSQQNGECRQCGMRFDEDEPILSKTHGRRRYYHIECARRLNII